MTYLEIFHTIVGLYCITNSFITYEYIILISNLILLHVVGGSALVCDSLSPRHLYFKEYNNILENEAYTERKKGQNSGNRSNQWFVWGRCKRNEYMAEITDMPLMGDEPLYHIL